MAAILQFDIQKRTRSSAAALSGSAEIIIFPGVRFERLDAACDIPVPPAEKNASHGSMRRRARRTARS